MHAFPQMSESHILRKLPMIRGWAYFAWAMESNPWLNVKRSGPGYIAQEIQKRM